MNKQDEVRDGRLCDTLCTGSWKYITYCIAICDIMYRKLVKFGRVVFMFSPSDSVGECVLWL